MINISQDYKILTTNEDYIQKFCNFCNKLAMTITQEFKYKSHDRIYLDDFIFPDFWKQYKKNNTLNLQNIFSLTKKMIEIINKKNDRDLFKIINYRDIKSLSKLQIKLFEENITMLHKILWKNECILYPIGTPSHLKLKPSREILERVFRSDTKTTKIIDNYSGENNLQTKHQIRRIILSTNWYTEEEIENNDIVACCKILQSEFMGYTSYVIKILMHIFLNTNSDKILELNEFKNKLKFLKKVNLTIDLTKTTHDNLYDHFLAESANIENLEKFKRYNKQRNSFSVLNRDKTGQYIPKLEVKKQMALIYDKFKNAKDINEKVKLTKQYFVTGKKIQRPFTHNTSDKFDAFPGHSISSERLKPWIFAYTLWIKQRTLEENKESIENAKTAYHSFLEYILIYIKWHNNIYPTKIKEPSSPHEVTRFPYISNLEVEENNFLTFNKFLNFKQLSPNTIKSQYLKIKHFFYFIETLNGMYPEISFQGYKTPITDIDSPKGTKYGKTTKIPLPPEAYRGILQFLYTMIYCIESHNDNLLNKRTFRLNTFNKEYITPMDLGFTPILYKDKKIIPLNKIRNFLSVTQYFINDETITLGNIAPAILLLVMLETGQRGQNIQWLDIESFDDESQLIEKSHSVSILYINTDKIQNTAFKTFIPTSAMYVLRRFKKFQKMRNDPYRESEIFYENRKTTRFEKIKPLFRGSKSNPISDSTYSDCWDRLLKSYEDVHTQIFDTEFNSTFIDNGNKEHKIFTPHAVRATVIKDLTSTMPSSTVCQIIGHTNISSTEYYVVNTLEELSNKIYTDRLILDTSKTKNQFINDIKTDSTKAINDYGCCTLSINHILNHPENALDAIKTHGLDNIDSQPTHYCLVNSNCPHDIVTTLGGRRLCGMCPISLKCVDHLPAISAKQKFLKEKISWMQKHVSMIYEKKGQCSETIEIENNISILLNEFYSWAYTEAILLDIYNKISGDYANKFLTFNPEIVKKIINIIQPDNPDASFFFNRILDSDIYPEFSTENVQSKAILFTNRFRDDIEDLHTNGTSQNQSINIAASQIRQIIKRTGKTIEDLLSISQSSNHNMLPTLDLSIYE